MERANDHTTHRFYAATRFLHQTQQHCYDKCVVDFQTKDLSAMEKECSNACVRKHMTILNEITGNRRRQLRNNIEGQV